MRVTVGRATDQGRLRDNNEDAFLVDDAHSLFAIADGMGGHAAGEVASRTAIEALRASVASGAAINDAVKRANDAVLERAAGNDDLTGMGTTMTAVLLLGGNQLLVGHVGDSRAYLVHDGALSRITIDHSLVEELVREGRITPEQAEAHPQRAIVTRALGIDTNIDVDVYTVEVAVGDRVIVCSDGLSDMLRERDIERLARAEGEAQRVAETLVDAAHEAGGADNITVLVVEIDEVDAAAALDPEALAGPDEHTSVLPLVAPPAPEPEPEMPRVRRSRWRTVRGVLLVVLPLIVILGVAAGVLGWYARSSYYVGTANGEVVIYKGVPGGVLGWNPTIDTRTGIAVDDLPPIDQDQVQTNGTKGSRETAENYVTRLDAATSTTTTTVPRTTTTTTVKRPRTTTTRPRANP